MQFVGLPEGTEGRSPEILLENWLIDTFGREQISATFVVDRAHWIPMTPGPPGSPPRTFIAKLLNSKDRDSILRLRRELTNNKTADPFVVWDTFKAFIHGYLTSSINTINKNQF